MGMQKRTFRAMQTVTDLSKPSLKSRLNTARAGLVTVLGLSHRGFFIPFRHAASVPTTPPAYEAIEELMRGKEDAFSSFLDRFSDHSGDLLAAIAGRFHEADALQGQTTRHARFWLLVIPVPAARFHGLDWAQFGWWLARVTLQFQRARTQNLR